MSNAILMNKKTSLFCRAEVSIYLAFIELQSVCYLFFRPEDLRNAGQWKG
jgi:hypothetical protein